MDERAAHEEDVKEIYHDEINNDEDDEADVEENVEEGIAEGVDTSDYGAGCARTDFDNAYYIDDGDGDNSILM